MDESSEIGLEGKEMKIQFPIAIAHALGEIGGTAYTNSKEAITKSLRLGFQIFEADIDVTKDGKVILFHDLRDVHEKKMWMNGHVWEKEWSEIRDFKYDGIYSPLTLTDLLEFMVDNPEIYVVFDVKRRKRNEISRANKIFLKILKKNGVHGEDEDARWFSSLSKIFSMTGWSKSFYRYSDEYVFEKVIKESNATSPVLNRIVPQINFENRKYFSEIDEFPIRIWKCVTKLGLERELVEARRLGCEFLATSKVKDIKNILTLCRAFSLKVLVFSISDQDSIEKLKDQGVHGFFVKKMMSIF